MGYHNSSGFCKICYNLDRRKNRIPKLLRVNNKVCRITKNCECGKLIYKDSVKCKRCNYIDKRKVDRPTYDILLSSIERIGYCGTGREYGVSDTTVRKWINKYEKLQNIEV